MRIFERFFLGICFVFTLGIVATSAVFCSSNSNTKNNWHPNIESVYKEEDFNKIFNTNVDQDKAVIVGLNNKNDITNLKIPSFVEKNGVKVPVDISKEFLDSLKANKSEVKSLTIGGNVNLELLGPNYFNRLESLEFENGITKIPNYSFITPTLKEIKIPNSVEIIDSQAFRNTSIKEIELPNTIKQILSQAFAFTSKLEKVTFRVVDGAVPTEKIKIGSAIFESTSLVNFEFPNSIKDVEFDFLILSEIFFPFYNSTIKNIKSSSELKEKFLFAERFKTYIQTKNILWNVF